MSQSEPHADQCCFVVLSNVICNCGILFILWNHVVFVKSMLVFIILFNTVITLQIIPKVHIINKEGKYNSLYMLQTHCVQY